jgi:hypothetical protein
MPISFGLQTTPSRPEAFAKRARRTTCSAAGENRDTDNLGTRIRAGYCLDRSAHHRLAAGRMNVEDRHSESRERSGGAGHRVRNVMKFHVGEDRHAEFDDGSHARRASCRNELEADLQPAHMRPDGARKLKRAGQILRVQGNEEGVFESRAAHRDGVLDPESRPGKRLNFDF